MTRVHVWGASGYAAAEAVRLLHGHPAFEIGVLESRSHAGELAADHFPALRSTAYRFDACGSLLEAVNARDVVLTAGNEDEVRSIVPELLARSVRVIDLSACYRFDTSAAYGLTEWYREAIAGAQLVANPGCYPTCALLGLLPLAEIGTPRHVVIDAKSGITGAGRMPRVTSLFAEVSGDVRAYGLTGHRHQPEIERYLRAGGLTASVTFTPHVVPLARGMLVDAYAIYESALDVDAVDAAYARAYRDASFVRVLDRGRAPSVPAVVGTNDAELCIDAIGTVVRVICAIDNLGKGAAGQAIANLNLMCGYPEESGLSARAVFA
jgi:N-acetyl-gamma-glutamyl-phosphate reductase